MKVLTVILLVLTFSGIGWAADDEVKIIRMNGDNYKIWTDKAGIRRIDPIFFVKKSGAEGDKKQTALTDKAGPEVVAVAPAKIEEADPGNSVVEDMAYDACRASLAAAEAMASVYNVIFDYPNGQKFTVLMVVDTKTVQLKCEYGTRIATTWEK